MSAASSPAAAAAAYDRQAELRALDATLSGVHGLVASGVTAVPRIFRVPDPEPPPLLPPSNQEAAAAPPSIPVVDLGGACGDREAVVAAVRRAAAEWGFFQVTGHGVPAEVADAAVTAARAFHESGGGEGTDKARLYSRDPARAAKYNCNFDLYQSPVANWRDTLYLRMAPDPPPAADMPEYCRLSRMTSSKAWNIGWWHKVQGQEYLSRVFPAMQPRQGCSARSRSYCQMIVLLCTEKHLSKIM